MRKCSTRGRPKTRHETQADAESQRRYLVSVGKWTLAMSNTYHCDVCGFWHAGRITVNRGRARNQTKNKPRRLDTQ